MPALPFLVIAHMAADTEAMIARCGGVEILLSAIRHHKDSEPVQRSCLSALRNLVCCGECVETSTSVRTHS